MKKRILALSLAAALVVGAMASCTKKEEPVSSAEARDVALTLWGAQDDQDFLKEVSADFAKSYADEHADVSSVTVDVQIVGEDQSSKEVLKDINAAADVFGIPSDQTKQFVDAKAIYAMPEAVTKEITAVVGELNVSKAFYDGSYYGFPYADNTAQIMYYNTDVFSAEEAGNLNTMLEKNLGDVKTLGHEGNGFDSTTWYFTVGAELFTGGDKSVCTMDSDECVEALKFVQANAGKIYVNSTDDAVSMIKDGKLAAWLAGSWNAQKMKDAFGDKLGVAVLPKVTINGKEYQMKCFGGVKYYAVNAASKEPEVAIALAKFLSSEETQLKRFEVRGAIPTATGLAENETVTSDPIASAYMTQCKNTVVQQPIIPGAWWGDTEAIFKDVYDGNLKDDAIKAKLTEAVASWKAAV